MADRHAGVRIDVYGPHRANISAVPTCHAFGDVYLQFDEISVSIDSLLRDNISLLRLAKVELAPEFV